MDKMLIGLIGFEVGWLASIYFAYLIFFRNQNRYIESILSFILTAVSGWAMGAYFIIWIVALEIVLLIIIRKVKPL